MQVDRLMYSKHSLNEGREKCINDVLLQLVSDIKKGEDIVFHIALITCFLYLVSFLKEILTC